VSVPILNDKEQPKAADEKHFYTEYLKTGQMARDMTLFVDDDGKAYHIYSSESNDTLHVALLTDDYLKHSGQYVRIFPGKRMEAPSCVQTERQVFSHHLRLHRLGSQPRALSHG
jgi:hypothetical protein